MARQVLTYPDIPPVLTQAAGDARYSLVAHNHDAAYATVAHLHTGVYLPVAHEPGVDPHTQYYNQARGDARYLQTTTAASTYSPLGHLHDATYVNVTGDGMTGPLTVTIPAGTPDADAITLTGPRPRLRVQATGSTTASRFGQEYAGSGAVIADNLYTHASFTGTGWGRDDITKGGSSFTLNQTQVSLLMAKPGANPITSWLTRWTVDTAGKWWVYGDNGTLPGGGLQITLQRNPATDWQAYRLGGGIAYDTAFYRKANSDHAAIGFSNDGINFNDLFQFTTVGTFYVGDQTGGGAPAQQRYIRVAYNSSSGATGATCAIEMATPNPGFVGIDCHVPNVAKWGMLYANAGGVYLGRDIGWGNPALVQVSANSIGISSAGNIVLGAAGQYVHLASDGQANLGHPSYRWGTVYAVAGAINTSHVSKKEDFSPLDPVSCAEAVMGTDWLAFFYKADLIGATPPPPLPVPDAEPETPEMKAKRVEQDAENMAFYEEGREAQEAARHQKGYVLGSADYRVSDLFGQDDRESANANSDLAVVACALQHCLLEIAELKARLA